MIELQNFSKNYDEKCAVCNISLKTGIKKITAVLGLNGAGKSTLLKAICARHFSNSGLILVNGIDVQENPEEVKKIVGFAEEIPFFPEDFTVKEYLSFIKKLFNSKDENHALELLSLEEVKNKKIKTLSKGFKQRLNIAKTVIQDSKILVLDEPSVSLDPAQMVKMREIIEKLSENHEIVLSTHLISEVEQFDCQIIILNEGKLVFSGTKEELLEKTDEISVEKAFLKLTEEKNQFQESKNE